MRLVPLLSTLLLFLIVGISSILEDSGIDEGDIFIKHCLYDVDGADTIIFFCIGCNDGENAPTKRSKSWKTKKKLKDRMAF